MPYFETTRALSVDDVLESGTYILGDLDAPCAVEMGPGRVVGRGLEKARKTTR